MAPGPNDVYRFSRPSRCIINIRPWATTIKICLRSFEHRRSDGVDFSRFVTGSAFFRAYQPHYTGSRSETQATYVCLVYLQQSGPIFERRRGTMNILTDPFSAFVESPFRHRSLPRHRTGTSVTDKIPQLLNGGCPPQSKHCFIEHACMAAYAMRHAPVISCATGIAGTAV